MSGWPETDEKQQTKIASLAQGVLDARKDYPDSSLADLYDLLTMPPDLRKAHNALDKAVMQTHGYKAGTGEADIVADCCNGIRN